MVLEDFINCYLKGHKIGKDNSLYSFCSMQIKQHKYVINRGMEIKVPQRRIVNVFYFSLKSNFKTIAELTFSRYIADDSFIFKIFVFILSFYLFTLMSVLFLT